MVRSPVWGNLDLGLSSTYFYPSGGFHGAWDVRTPLGTPLYAYTDAVVLDCHDGVRNNTPGRNPGPGAPSNYVFLGVKYKGRDAAMYLQHMSPGLKVRTGQRVSRGQLLGHSGNSGNSTGPHLHLSAQWSHSTNRYLYLISAAARIYPPSLWTAEEDDMPLNDSDKAWIKKTVQEAIHEALKDMPDEVWERTVNLDGKRTAMGAINVTTFNMVKSIKDKG